MNQLQRNPGPPRPVTPPSCASRSAALAAVAPADVLAAAAPRPWEAHGSTETP